MSIKQDYEEHFVKSIDHYLKMSGDDFKGLAKKCGKSKIEMINYYELKVSPTLKTADRIINVITESK